MLRRVVWQKLTDVSEVLTASVIRADRLMTEKVSEAPVNFCHTTRRSIQEHSSIYLVLILQTSKFANTASFQTSKSNFQLPNKNKNQSCPTTRHGGAWGGKEV
jgi:hypothetical protein